MHLVFAFSSIFVNNTVVVYLGVVIWQIISIAVILRTCEEKVDVLCVSSLGDQLYHFKLLSNTSTGPWIHCRTNFGRRRDFELPPGLNPPTVLISLGWNPWDQKKKVTP